MPRRQWMKGSLMSDLRSDFQEVIYFDGDDGEETMECDVAGCSDPRVYCDYLNDDYCSWHSQEMVDDAAAEAQVDRYLEGKRIEEEWMNR